MVKTNSRFQQLSQPAAYTFAEIFIMCHFHTWVRDNENGYVVECLHCKKIQVCFGNIAATFYLEQFDELRKYVGSMWESHQPVQQNDARTVVLHTPCEGFKILLSEK